MKEDNNKAKLLTIGIAVVLILIICGISLMVHAIQNKDKDSGSKLQSDIVEYANQGQEQEATAQEPEQEEPGQSKESSDEKAAAQVQEPVNEGGQAAAAKDTAVVVEEKKDEIAETIMEEEARNAAAHEENQKTTAKWQKETTEDLTKVEIDLPRQMSEMKGYWEAGNMEAVEDLAYLPRYRAASWKLQGTTRYYYFGDVDGENRPHGKGLAIYTDNQYYYGDWVNGVRSGNGMWIKYYVYDKNAKAKNSMELQHSYSGGWENDLPCGEGQEHYDFIDENLESDVGYNRNFIGSFKNGLYDGEIYITNYYKGGNSKEWKGNAVNGVWTPMGEKDKMGQYPIIVELTDSENYQWIKEAENKNQGVDGLISAAK